MTTLTEEQKAFIRERFVNADKGDFMEMVEGFEENEFIISLTIKTSEEHGIAVYNYKEIHWFNAYPRRVYVVFLKEFK